MKTGKKILSILLAVLMLVGVFAMTASAATINTINITTSFVPQVGGAFPTKSSYTAAGNTSLALTVESVNVTEVTSDGIVSATAPFKAGKTYQVSMVCYSEPNAFSTRSLTAKINGDNPYDCTRLSEYLAKVSYRFTTQSDIYTISVTADPYGYGKVIGGGSYGKGEHVTLSAIAYYGYSFTGWYRDNTKVSSNTNYQFTVSGDEAYTAKFSPLSYTVTATADTGGSVTGSGSYDYGRGATVKATPNTGYHFTGWFNGNTKVSSYASYNFAVTGPVTLTAKFELNTYTVTVNAGTGGIAAGSSTYGHGSNVTVTAAPGSGYHFIGWFNGDSKVSDSASYTFTVTEPVTLTAKFEKDSSSGNTDPTPTDPQPTDPQPSGCPWCGGQHNGNFFQKIIGWFHNIFAKIFGAKY